MVYICGIRETLGELRTKEGYSGTLEDYTREFCRLNRHVTPSGGMIPSYTPVIPLNGLDCDVDDARDVVNEVRFLSTEEREKLWYLQEGNQDVPTLLATQDVMHDGQTYASEFRSWFDSPLISTPWISTGSMLTKDSAIDLFEESSKFGAGMLRNSTRYRMLDDLYELMFQRDALNHEIALLKQAGGASARVTKLEGEVKELTGKIKQILPKRLDSKMQGYLGSRFTPDAIRKMRMNSYSVKMANKGGRMATLNLQFLSRSGLQGLKRLISGMRKVGEAAGKISFVLNAGFVAYDTYEAYKHGGNAGKVLFSGVAGIGAAAGVGAMISTSSLGALTIGAIAGDAAIGGALLVCSPIIGTFVAIVVGVAVVGAVAYVASKYAGEMYDYVEELWNSKRSQEWRNTMKQTVEDAAQSLYDFCKSTYDTGSSWLPQFYGAAN